MESIDIKAFREANNLTQKQLGDYLGIDKGFVSAIEHGKSKFPKAKFTLLLNNPHNWDVSMLCKVTSGLHSQSLQGRETELSTEQVRSAIEQTLKPGTTDYFISYLEKKIENQDSLIRELYQQIGMLEAKLELARKGETASAVGGCLSADAV